MTEDAGRDVKAGQVWWDGFGFAEVRAVNGDLATVSGPTEFWNDCRTTEQRRRVAITLMMDPGSKWEGPYTSPRVCPHAELHLGFGWGKRGLII